MKNEVLEPAYAAELLRRQHTLESEVAVVIEDIKLISILSRVGIPRQIGSSMLGLMTWRDIDFNVVSSRLSIYDAFEVMRLLAIHPRIHKMRYMNESGEFNPTGDSQDERYYFALFYAQGQSEEWKIDISFWLNDGPRSEMEDLQNIRSQLTPKSRMSILWLKDVWHRLPSYRSEVFCMDIYDAVLKHGVQTPSEFDRYLVERGKPKRQ